jgi:hypothetical protein
MQDWSLAILMSVRVACRMLRRVGTLCPLTIDGWAREFRMRFLGVVGGLYITRVCLFIQDFLFHLCILV